MLHFAVRLWSSYEATWSARVDRWAIEKDPIHLVEGNHITVIWWTLRFRWRVALEECFLWSIGRDWSRLACSSCCTWEDQIGCLPSFAIQWPSILLKVRGLAWLAKDARLGINWACFSPLLDSFSLNWATRTLGWGRCGKDVCLCLYNPYLATTSEGVLHLIGSKAWGRLTSWRLRTFPQRTSSPGKWHYSPLRWKDASSLDLQASSARNLYWSVWSTFSSYFPHKYKPWTN